MVVLVIGGYGFIGSHLVRRLLRCGARVAVAGRDGTNIWRLRDAVWGVDRHGVDVRHGGQVAACVGRVQPDVIFHLAAYGLDSTNCNPKAAAETNVLGTLHVLEAAKANGVRRVVNLGSSSEYGDRAGPIAEDAPLTPVDVYGSTKAAATLIAHTFARDEKVSLITLRPFGVFGAYEAPHKVFSYAIVRALQHLEVRLTPCEQLRDYCYVANIVDGLVAAATTDAVHDAVFNIGAGEVHPLRHYIDLIFERLPTDKKPIYGALPYRANERWCAAPDIRKIEDQLGWRPRIGLEEGITRTVHWFVQNRATWMSQYAPNWGA